MNAFSEYSDGYDVNSEKRDSITDIRERDTKVFIDWVATHPEESRLDLSLHALRYLIPSRVFNLASDPYNVTIRISDRTKEKLSFYVVETVARSVTNRESLLRTVASSDPLQPHDVDIMHWESREDVVNGIIDTKDFIFNKIVLERVGDSWDADLFVKSYDDREELRGKGVARSFYNRLEEFALETNYNNITGQNNENNIGFFRGTLGRKPLTTLAPSVQDDFLARYQEEITNPEYFTVDPLHAEE